MAVNRWVVTVVLVAVAALAKVMAAPQALTLNCRVGGVVRQPQPADGFVAYGLDCVANGVKMESVTIYPGN